MNKKYKIVENRRNSNAQHLRKYLDSSTFLHIVGYEWLYKYLKNLPSELFDQIYDAFDKENLFNKQLNLFDN